MKKSLSELFEEVKNLPEQERGSNMLGGIVSITKEMESERLACWEAVKRLADKHNMKINVALKGLTLDRKKCVEEVVEETTIDQPLFP